MWEKLTRQNAIVARLSSGYSSASVTRIRWPSPSNASSPVSRHSVRRARRICESSLTLGAGVSRRDQPTISPPLASVKCAGSQTKSRRSSGGSISTRFKPMNWHPIVAAIDDRFQHRPQSRIGVGQPFKFGIPWCQFRHPVQRQSSVCRREWRFVVGVGAHFCAAASSPCVENRK